MHVRMPYVLIKELTYLLMSAVGITIKSTKHLQNNALHE